MLTPADRITFTDDGHAWIVVDAHENFPPSPGEMVWAALDRPCDHCGALVRAGDQVIDTEGRRWVNGRSVARHEPFRCPDCIDGRHTFDIEVVRRVFNGGAGGTSTDTYRVSVVPGMVLPIEEVDPPLVPYPDHDALVRYAGDASEPWFIYTEHDDMTDTVWGVPPAAAPGMWAVKLKVQS